MIPKKQILLICAVVVLVGCGSVYELPSGGGDPSLKPKVVKIVKVEQPDANRINLNLGDIIGQEYEAKPNSDPIVEKAIRRSLKKPEGELTKADYDKVTALSFVLSGLTEVPKGIEKLTQLKDLDLWHNKLTSVKSLEKLTQLRSLALFNNQLTSVKGLEKLTKLTTLHLNDNKLTEVKGLEKLTQLKGLALGKNKLTDVEGLEKLTQLITLNLSNNPDLTKAQIDELQKALPKCKILSNTTK